MSYGLGPFRLDKKIGKGANGDVWFGRHADSRLPVAVKVLKPELAMNERALLAIKNEVRAVATLDHPHIITIYDHGVIPLELELDTEGAVASGSPYLVMEWAGGGTLDDIPTPQDWPTLRGILLTLLDALAHAHAGGVVHRDLKPANILFCGPTEPRPGLKLADFGLAVRNEPEKDIRRLLGTPHYMAPEQWHSRIREQGPWTDLYAVGCLVFRILTGRGPFAASTIKQMRQAHLQKSVPRVFAPFEVPGGLQRWVDSLMAKDRRKRFQRAADAAAALRALDGSRREHPRRRTQNPGSVLVGAGLGLYGLRTIPLVDRARQRAALWEALDRVHQSGAEVVALTGAAGTGKSRLAEWLGRRAHELGEANLVQASYGWDGGPQDGLGPMLARTMKCLGLEERPEPLRDQIVEWLRLYGPADPYEVDALQALVGRGPNRKRVHFRSPRERRAVVLRLLERIARERPVICWLDDVQWSPEAISLAHQLLDETPNTRVLLLMTAQDEGMAREKLAASRFEALMTAHHERALRITVPALEPSDRADLARGLLGMDGELAEQVAARSAGNPLFAVQLVADWVERDLLEVGDEGFRIRDDATVELPENLRRMWARRLAGAIDFRPPDDLRALELAAVLGQEIDPGEWAAACERSWAIPMPDLVDTLIRSRLARCGDAGPEAGWSFVHAMLREHLVERARSSGRLKVHNRTCAETLQQRGADPVRIAHHLLESGRATSALALLQEGIAASITGGGTERARILLDQHDAILADLGVEKRDWRRVDGLMLRGELGLAADELIEGASHAQEAVAISRALGLDRRLARAQAVSGRLALTLGKLDEAQRDLDHAEQALRGMSESRLLASVVRARAQLLDKRGQPDEAREMLSSAAEIYEEISDWSRSGACSLDRARILARLGQMVDASYALKRAGALFERAGDLVGASSANAQLGDIWREAGRRAEAIRAYRAAVQQLRAAGAMGGLLTNVEERLAELTATGG